MKTFLLLVTLFGCLSALGTTIYIQHLKAWFNQPGPLRTSKIYHLERGTPLKKLCGDLEELEIINSANYCYAWTRWQNTYRSYQSGLYQFHKGVAPKTISHQMIAGEIHIPEVSKITIPEGFTAQKIYARLEAHAIGRQKTYTQLHTDPRFLKRLNIHAKTLEGFLYPATYTFHGTLPTPEQALERMVHHFFDKLPKDYEEQLTKRKLTLAEGITFASLIEAETLHDEERPMIAEVIWTRLKQGQPLGIDAALIYGIEDYQGDIKWRHLRDETNPYNTRIHKGLPPTPICSPRLASLQAVLNPSQLGYMFYVLKPGSSFHHFSKTIREHNRHVKKLVKWSKKQP